MPYRVVGRKVYHKIDGRWKLKQTARSHARAIGTVRLLRGIEHGWLPTGLNAKRRRKK